MAFFRFSKRAGTPEERKTKAGLMGSERLRAEADMEARAARKYYPNEPSPSSKRKIRRSLREAEVRQSVLKKQFGYDARAREAQEKAAAKRAYQRELNRMEAERVDYQLGGNVENRRRMAASEPSGGYANKLLSNIRRSEALKKEARRRRPIDIRKVTKAARIDIQKDREYEQNKRIIAYETGKYGQEKYAKSIGGRISRGISFVRNPARVLYQRQGQERPRLARDPYSRSGQRGAYRVGVPRQTAPGVQSGRVGRPYGTYQYRHPVTGQPIGVYEYRKILAAQLRNERMQAQAQSGYSPQQLQALQRIQAQQQYAQSNVEGRTIPDTYGQVNMQSIHQEADAYAHLFD